jgi:hypothetical protein
MDRQEALEWLSLALQLPISTDDRENLVNKAERHFQNGEYEDMMRCIRKAGQAR